MFAVNFYASCSVSRGNSIGKEPIKTRLGKSRLPIYTSYLFLDKLFILANSLKG